MASYLSQPRSFTQYIPEVNAELYGATLQKDEQEYQKGVQKIYQSLDSVASIPVSNPSERLYLQNKVDTITSDLNKNINTDWSNLAMQRMTDSHIKAMVNDPYIQKAVYNSSIIKKQAESRNNDIDKWGEGVVSDNTSAWDEDYAKWYQNAKLGETFNSQYTPYINVDEVIKKRLKELHPKSEVIEDVSGADGSTKYDTVTYSVSGIDPSEVRKQVGATLVSTPGALDQLSVSARARYKNFTADNYAVLKQGVTAQHVEGNNIELERLKLLQAKVSDSAQKTLIDDKIKTLELENTTLMPGGKYDPTSDIERFNSSDESDKRNLYTSLYQQGVVNSMVDLYSYGGEYKVTHGGKSPRDKAIEDAKMEREVKTFDMSVEAHNLDMQIKQAKLNGASKATDLTQYPSTKGAVDPTDMNNAYLNYKTQAVQQGLDYTQSEIDFMASAYKRKGMNVYAHFEEVGDGHWKVKSGNLTDNGNTVNREEYFIKGWTDEKGIAHKGVINDWLDKSANGDYFTDDKGYNLTNTEVIKLREMKAKGAEYQASLYAVAKDEEEANKNPLIAEYTGRIKQLDLKPVTTANGKYNFNGQDVEKLLAADKELYSKYRELIKPIENSMSEPREKTREYNRILEDLKPKVYSSYGLPLDKVSAMSNSPLVQQLKTKSSNAIAERDKILNQRVISRGYVYQPSTLNWTIDADKKDASKTNEEIYGSIKNYVFSKYKDYNKLSGFQKVMVDRKEEDEPQVMVTWNGNKGKYIINISDVKHGNVEPIEIDPVDARSLGIPSIAPEEDHLERIMKIYGGQSNPPGSPSTFQNAHPISTVGNFEYRVHIFDEGSSYTIQPYKIDTRTKGKPITLPDIPVHTHDWGQVKAELEKLASGTGSNLLIED